MKKLLLLLLIIGSPVILYGNSCANSCPSRQIIFLSVDSVGDTTVSLSWSHSMTLSIDDGFDIFKNGIYLTSIPVSSNSYTVPNLSPNTTYNFTISAYYAATDTSSIPSNQVSATTSGGGSSPPSSINPKNESFEAGFGQWNQDTGDDINWIKNSGGTPSSGTGPTTGNDGAHYLFLEATGNSSKTGRLKSPLFSIPNNYQLEFAYHMYGANMGSLKVEFSTNGINWFPLWSKSGDQGNIWNTATIDLSSYGGDDIYLRFNGLIGGGYQSDISIDNLVFNSSTIGSCGEPALSDTENYVFTRTYQNENSNATGAIEQVTYFDGLGRPKQQVGIGHSDTSCKDLVTHFAYDEYGRQTKDYLPYVDTGISGSYRTGDIDYNTRSYYNGAFPDDFYGSGPSNPFSEKQLEASPLSRLEQQAAPGYDWRLGGGHEIEMDYQTNATSEVRYYYVSFSGGNTEAPILSGGSSHYTAGELYKTISKDENHSSGTLHTTEEFKDKQGRVILKRTYADSDNNGDGDTADAGETNAKHDTYYVYDDYGNLTFVLPPKVVHDSSISLNERNELCYQYKYDQRNRLIEKKIPGKGWEYIVYNKLDQPVMHTDPNLKSLNKWLFTKYDAFGRVAYTGSTNKSVTVSRASLQNTVNANDSYVFRTSGPNTYAGTPVYYSNAAEPISMSEIYTINYYDSYNLNFGFTVPTSNGLGETIVKGTGTKGLATVTKTKVLGTSQWITTAMGYDSKGRVVWTKTDNPFLGTTDIIEHDLDFTGTVLQTKTTHQKSGKADIMTLDTFEYDHMKRLTKHSQSINGGSQEVIAANTYDELGQLKTKEVGNALQTVDYAYNVRGWLKSINDVGNLGTDLFSFEISYNNPDLSGSVGLYNGNISETIWQTANDKNASTPVSSRAYQFEYDDLNRLVDADYFVNSSTPYITEFDMSSVYDKNGNITKLSRGRSYGTIDALSYSYNNNQLIEVVDNGYSTSKGKGFVDDGVAGNDYNYDANGNLTSDANKGIPANGISYNHLNLPTSVSLPGGTITYTYDATGVKLEKKVAESGNSNNYTFYSGNFVYKRNGDSGNGTLEFFSTPEGYVSYDNGQFNYVYNYTDHLGNVRLSYSDLNNNGTIEASSEILDEKNYYPFGLRHKGYNNVVSSNANSVAQKFKFNGAELEESLGLNLYEMDVRSYDPAIARWNRIDPVDHHHLSPYNAFDNNPVFFADPSGADSEPSSTEEWMEANGITEDDLITIYQADDSNDSDTEGGCDDCSKCPETCNDSNSSATNDNNSTNNTDWGGIALGVGATNNIIIPGIKQSMVVTTIPIYDEAGKLIGQWSSYSKVPFKALQKVGGVLKPLGPIANVVSFASNTEQVATGEMSVGRYAFNTVGTGGSIYAAAAYGGPVGVGVGGLVYLGDMTYKAVEEIGEAKANHPNPAVRSTSWSDVGFWWNRFKSIFSGAMPTGN